MEREQVQRTFEKILEGFMNKNDYGLISEIDFNATRSDNGFDSLDSIEFVMDCEKEFNIGIPDDVAAELDSQPLSAWVDYLAENVA